jgi:hypothetical protein
MILIMEISTPLPPIGGFKLPISFYPFIEPGGRNYFDGGGACRLGIFKLSAGY